MTLDGGSAAPATPDVLRTPDRWLAEPEFDGIDVLDPDGWRGANGRLWTDPISRAEFRARLWRSTITGPVRGLGHSGVAGEPKATPKGSCEDCDGCEPSDGCSCPGCPHGVPSPAEPAAAILAGAVVVSDEAVDAYYRGEAVHRDDGRDCCVRAGLTEAAPAIIEAYLRREIQAREPEPVPEALWEQMRQMARDAESGGPAAADLDAILRALTPAEEIVRCRIATALIRFGVENEGDDLFEWHPCTDNPNCLAAQNPAAPCACSGRPYLSDAAWASIRETLAGRLLPEGGETREEWRVRWGDDLEFDAAADSAKHAATFVKDYCARYGERAVAERRYVGPWVAVDQEPTDG